MTQKGMLARLSEAAGVQPVTVRKCARDLAKMLDEDGRDLLIELRDPKELEDYRGGCGPD